MYTRDLSECVHHLEMSLFLPFRTLICVHHLEMSLFLPFRNVTVAGFGRRAGAEPVRSAAPARRPPYGHRASVSPLGLSRNLADFEQSRIALIASARCLLAAGFGPCNLLLADKGE